MFSRKIRSTLPVIPSKLGTFYSHKTVAKKEKERKERQVSQYNKRHRSKNLSPLLIGDKVWVIDLRVYGEIAQKDKTPNSYWVQTHTSEVRRNRFHLVPAPYCNEKFEKKNWSTAIPIECEQQGIEQNINDNQNEREVCIENQCRDNSVSNMCENEIVQNEQVNQRPVRIRKEPGWMRYYVKK